MTKEEGKEIVRQLVELFDSRKAMAPASNKELFKRQIAPITVLTTLCTSFMALTKARYNGSKDNETLSYVLEEQEL